MDMSYNKSSVLKCPNCGEEYSTISNLVRHQKWRCPSAKNVDHIELTRRKNTRSANDCEEIEKQQKQSTTFVMDKEMEGFISSHPDAYVKYRLCENPRNPVPVPGFWPALFDYRAKMDLIDVEENICAKNGFKILASILTDAYLYHGVEYITYNTKAFIETNEGIIYQISDYRVPKSHVTINNGVKARLNQPRFNVEENNHSATVSFHEAYIKLLPEKIFRDDTEDKIHEEKEADIAETIDEEGMENLFSQENNEVESDDEESFSQHFSQVSLQDSQEDLLSPPQKKIKVELGTMSSLQELKEI